MLEDGHADGNDIGACCTFPSMMMLMAMVKQGENTFSFRSSRRLILLITGTHALVPFSDDILSVVPGTNLQQPAFPTPTPKLRIPCVRGSMQNP